MTRSARSRPLRTGGQLWGQRRARAGISLRELSRLSGVSRGLLSQMENGRTFPRAEEFDRVMAAIEAASPLAPAAQSIEESPPV